MQTEKLLHMLNAHLFMPFGFSSTVPGIMKPGRHVKSQEIIFREIFLFSNPGTGFRHFTGMLQGMERNFLADFRGNKLAGILLGCFQQC